MLKKKSNSVPECSKLVNNSKGKKTRLPDIYQVDCASDDIAVFNLPVELAPKCSGPILSKYLADIKNLHNKAFSDFGDDISKANQNVEDKVRKLSEILATEIQETDREIREIVKRGIDSNFLSRESSNNLLSKVKELFKIRCEHIAEFKQNGLKLEAERAELIKVIMRDWFQRIVAIGHVPLKTILQNFDDHIYETNQQLCTNEKEYFQIEKELCAENEQKLKQIRSLINEHCIEKGKPLERWQSAHFDQHCTFFDKRPLTAQSVPKFTLEGNELEVHIKCLVETYREAAERLYSSFGDQLSNLKASFKNETQQMYNNVDLSEEVIRMISNLLNEFNLNVPFFNQRESESEAKEFAEAKRSIWLLGQCLIQTFDILNNAAHLWDAHILRVALTQKLIMADVEDLITRNDAKEMLEEVSFNCHFAELCHSSCSEMDSKYDYLMKILRNTLNLYENNYQEEISRVENYLNIAPSMEAILNLEIQCFLEKYPPNELISQIVYHNKESFKNSSLASLISQTDHHIATLLRWAAGFLEAINNNIDKLPEELTKNTIKWVKQKTENLEYRYYFKRISHSVREDRIKRAYNLRLEKIHSIEQNLVTYENKINSVKIMVKKSLAKFMLGSDPHFFPLYYWMEKIQNNANQCKDNLDMTPEELHFKLLSYVNRLPRLSQLFVDSVHETLEECKQNIMVDIVKAKIETLEYLSSVTMIFEGGVYSAEKAEKTVSVLLSKFRELENCEEEVETTLKHREVELKEKAFRDVTSLLMLLTRYKSFSTPPPVFQLRKMNTMSTMLLRKRNQSKSVVAFQGLSEMSGMNLK